MPCRQYVKVSISGGLPAQKSTLNDLRQYQIRTHTIYTRESVRLTIYGRISFITNAAADMSSKVKTFERI